MANKTTGRIFDYRGKSVAGVVLLLPADAPSWENVLKAADVLAERGADVQIACPQQQGQDFNDVLRAQGIVGVQAQLEEARPLEEARQRAVQPEEVEHKTLADTPLQDPQIDRLMLTRTEIDKIWATHRQMQEDPQKVAQDIRELSGAMQEARQDMRLAELAKLREDMHVYARYMEHTPGAAEMLRHQAPDVARDMGLEPDKQREKDHEPELER